MHRRILLWIFYSIIEIKSKFSISIKHAYGWHNLTSISRLLYIRLLISYRHCIILTFNQRYAKMFISILFKCFSIFFFFIIFYCYFMILTDSSKTQVEMFTLQYHGFLNLFMHICIYICRGIIAYIFSLNIFYRSVVNICLFDCLFYLKLSWLVLWGIILIIGVRVNVQSE